MDKEVVIIGAGHIFNIKEKIQEFIRQENGDALAVELDELRLRALLNTQKKNLPGIYSLLSFSQSIMAKKFGVTAGNEMIAAIETAKEMGLPVYCIDTDARHTIQKLWKELKLRDKIKLTLSVFLSIFMTKKKIEKEVKEMDYENLMEEIGKEFPQIKKLLIDDRNKYMVEKLVEILKQYDKVIAIVGEGHIKGMEELFPEGIKVKTIHLMEYLD